MNRRLDMVTGWHRNMLALVEFSHHSCWLGSMKVLNGVMPHNKYKMSHEQVQWHVLGPSLEGRWSSYVIKEDLVENLEQEH